MVRVLVTGDRNWDDYEMILDALAPLPPGSVLVEGCASGADHLAEVAAQECGLPNVHFPAEWRRYGKGAGPVRNQRMLAADPDIVYAFHDHILESKGTYDMVRRALADLRRVRLFDHAHPNGRIIESLGGKK